MKIGYLGAGTWGVALASLLADNGHQVILWDRNADRIKKLKETRVHSKLQNCVVPKSVVFTNDLKTAVNNVDMIVESVTSQGLRDVFKNILKIKKIDCPIVITSKGIEQHTMLLFSEVLTEVLGKDKVKFLGCLSGPSHAEEVIKKLPTSVVCSAYSNDVMMKICEAFNGPFFRVYPNSDILGVSFGGAMKNIIAIACGVSDGLGFGDNTKAALMTRGLHEMRKLCVTKNADPETLNGLSGMGDLCVTCLSKFSRNYKFGRLIADGYSLEEARDKISMVVEGAYTCVAARELAAKFNIPVPITEAVHAILYEKLTPKNVVKLLLQRSIKEEKK